MYYKYISMHLLLAMHITQGKPSNPELCIQVTVCGRDGKIYPTPCAAPKFPPPCYAYQTIGPNSCICRKETDCKKCESLVQGQKCGQYSSGPFRMNCGECCSTASSSSSQCAQWRCDAGGWLCQEQCPKPSSGCPHGSPLTDPSGQQLFCGRGPNRQNCPKGSSCVIDPLDRFAFCCLDEGAETCGCGEVCRAGQQCVDSGCVCFRAPCCCARTCSNVYTKG